MPRFNDWSSYLATVKKTQIEDKSPETGFQVGKTADFLRAKRLDSLSLIILDLMIPFKRPLSAFLTVTEPLSSLVLGKETTKKILDFSRGEDSFSELREALERGDK